MRPRTVKAADRVEADDLILDIGPETAAGFAEADREAGTIVWNGPVGVFEFDAFAKGTETVARAIAASPAFSIAGGGDTLAAIAKYGIENRTRLHLDRRRRVPRSARRQDPAGLRDPRAARRGATGIRLHAAARAAANARAPIMRRC